MVFIYLFINALFELPYSLHLIGYSQTRSSNQFMTSDDFTVIEKKKKLICIIVIVSVCTYADDDVAL